MLPAFYWTSFSTSITSLCKLEIQPSDPDVPSILHVMKSIFYESTQRWLAAPRLYDTELNRRFFLSLPVLYLFPSCHTYLSKHLMSYPAAPGAGTHAPVRSRLKRSTTPSTRVCPAQRGRPPPVGLLDRDPLRAKTCSAEIALLVRPHSCSCCC